MSLVFKLSFYSKISEGFLIALIFLLSDIHRNSFSPKSRVAETTAIVLACCQKSVEKNALLQMRYS